MKTREELVKLGVDVYVKAMRKAWEPDAAASAGIEAALDAATADRNGDATTVTKAVDEARAVVERAEREALAAVRQRDEARAELEQVRAQYDAVFELSRKAEMRAVEEADKRRAAEEEAAAYRALFEREECKAYALAEACLAARHAYTTLRKERRP